MTIRKTDKVDVDGSGGTDAAKTFVGLQTTAVTGRFAIATELPPAGEGAPRRPFRLSGWIGGRWSMAALSGAASPVRLIGSFLAMCLDTFVLMFRPPWAWREFIVQTWFVARVSFAPAVLMAIPFVVLGSYTLNILLVEIGAADFSGAGLAWGAVTQGGPIVTVLVISGAAASAMCADLGARAIREELDAMRVLGLNPVQALVVPRVLAATVVSVLLASVVTMTGLIFAFLFSVFLQHITPGAFVSGLTVLVGTPELIICLAKAAIFGLSGSLIACYKGMSVGGGPAGVGNAVNETVVYTFLALFVINVIATAVGVKATL